MEERQEQIAVTLKQVGHHYGARQVFSQVEASFHTGQVGVITGTNGSGKSTLFRIIAGLLQPAHGSVEVTSSGKTLEALERRSILGMVAPDITLYRELTAVENLQFFANLQGRELTRNELVEIFTELGLKGRGRDFVGSYSSGMRQRLKYALALLFNPPLLLLDEPTANLDVAGVEIVERIIARQKERAGGGLTLVATNEPREMDWGDVLIHLEPSP